MSFLDQSRKRLIDIVDPTHKSYSTNPDLSPGGRLITHGGNLNIHRGRTPIILYLADPFHSLVNLPWWRLLIAVCGGTFALWMVFAVGYYLCGRGALSGDETRAWRILDFFFFSVQTQTTIGFGDLFPVSLTANAIFVFQSMVGILWESTIFGLIFTKFARPTNRKETIIYSEKAIISVWDGVASLQFRIFNLRKHQVVEPQISLVLTHEAKTIEGYRYMKFQTLEVPNLTPPFLAVPWTVVHPLAETSPLHNKTIQWWKDTRAEIIAIFQGIDSETNGTFQVRKSFTLEELKIGNFRFDEAYHRNPKTDAIMIDLARFNDIFEENMSMGRIDSLSVSLDDL